MRSANTELLYSPPNTENPSPQPPKHLVESAAHLLLPKHAAHVRRAEVVAHGRWLDPKATGDVRATVRAGVQVGEEYHAVPKRQEPPEVGLATLKQLVLAEVVDMGPEGDDGVERLLRLQPQKHVRTILAAGGGGGGGRHCRERRLRTLWAHMLCKQQATPR